MGERFGVSELLKPEVLSLPEDNSRILRAFLRQSPKVYLNLLYNNKVGCGSKEFQGRHFKLAA